MLGRALRVPIKLARTLAVRGRPDTLIVHWANRRLVGRNWGDKLNPVLVRMLSGQNVIHVYDVFPGAGKPEHYVIGSSLERAQRRNGVVWGAGFLSAQQGLARAPRAIHAVRGHLSRERLVELGVDCPKVVGDPAILLPLLYKPRSIGRRYRAGIVAHCYERELGCVQPRHFPEDVQVIDITGGVFEVIDRICACDEILSSSLHGLVCAEAYGIPARWVMLSERVAGDGFKFRDFQTSIGRKPAAPATAESADDLLRLVGKPPEPLPRGLWRRHAEALLAVCPFTPRAAGGIH